MNLYDFVFPLVVGGVVADISHRIIDFWRSRQSGIQAGLQTLDDRLEALIQRRFSDFKFSEGTHQEYDRFIAEVVKTINDMVGDGVIIRRILRAIAEQNSDKAKELLLEQLRAFLGKITAGKLDDCPPELKQIINQEKEKLAVRVVANRVPIAFPALGKTEDAIQRDIRQAATANKINETEGPITQQDLERLIAESKARQEALRNH